MCYINLCFTYLLTCAHITKQYNLVPISARKLRQIQLTKVQMENSVLHSVVSAERQHLFQQTSNFAHSSQFTAIMYNNKVNQKYGPMPNVMVALPNIGGGLCLTPQSLADAHYQMLCSNAAKTRNTLKLGGVPETTGPISAASGPKFSILWGHVEEILQLNQVFLGLSTRDLVVKIQPNKVVRWCTDGDFLASFCVLYFQRATCSKKSCILNSH